MTSDTDCNFLPVFDPVITGGTTDTLQCQIRDKAVRATPEERVRQRVLRWLIHDKGWSKETLRLEKSYAWVSDSARRRLRPDIELLVDDQVRVVVECKRPGVPLGHRVDEQAIDYAIKARAKWIWTTNGETHGFLRQHGAKWCPVDSLEPLDVFLAPPVTDLEVPASAADPAAVARYWRALADPQFLDDATDYDQDFVLAVHRMLFGIPPKERCLPFSHGDVHILEDRGSAWHAFSNRGGGRYHTRYADFIGATRGRVEAVSVAVNRWHRGGLRLCAGVRKPNRTHHALQLNTEHCERDDDRNVWHVFHDGRMSQIANSDVMEAVREARRGGWIHDYGDGREWIYLGELPDAATWDTCRELLANLIHYAIIRTNLREAKQSG